MLPLALAAQKLAIFTVWTMGIVTLQDSVSNMLNKPLIRNLNFLHQNVFPAAGIRSHSVLRQKLYLRGGLDSFELSDEGNYSSVSSTPPSESEAEDSASNNTAEVYDEEPYPLNLTEILQKARQDALDFQREMELRSILPTGEDILVGDENNTDCPTNQTAPDDILEDDEPTWPGLSSLKSLLSDKVFTKTIMPDVQAAINFRKNQTFQKSANFTRLSTADGHPSPLADLDKALDDPNMSQDENDDSQGEADAEPPASQDPTMADVLDLIRAARPPQEANASQEVSFPTVALAVGGGFEASQLQDELCDAAEAGNASRVAALRRRGARPASFVGNSPNLSNTVTALHWAAAGGYTSVIDTLLDPIPPDMSCNSSCNKPSDTASNNTSTPPASSASPAALNPASAAARAHTLGSPGEPTACIPGDDASRQGADAGAVVGRPPPAIGVDCALASTAVTALHRACDRGETAAAAALLRRGADANRRDILGRTPLHRAAVAGPAELVRALLAAGADPAAADLLRDMPLHLAAYWGNPAAAEVLAAALPGSVRMRNRFYHTPVDLALLQNHTAVADLLRAVRAEHDAAAAAGAVGPHGGLGLAAVCAGPAAGGGGSGYDDGPYPPGLDWEAIMAAAAADGFQFDSDEPEPEPQSADLDDAYGVTSPHFWVPGAEPGGRRRLGAAAGSLMCGVGSERSDFVEVLRSADSAGGPGGPSRLGGPGGPPSGPGEPLAMESLAEAEEKVMKGMQRLEAQAAAGWAELQSGASESAAGERPRREVAEELRALRDAYMSSL